VSSSLKEYTRKSLGALLCAAVLMSAGCNNNYNNFYGVAWITATSEPGGTSATSGVPQDFASYTVNVDAITLTRNDGIIVTAVATPETVDFTKVTDISELWAAANVPDGTYLSATLTLDYTFAVISVMVNGVPTPATVRNTAGAPVTTISVNVTFDPLNPLVITPTVAATSAERLAVNFDLAASGYVVANSSPPVVVVNPYFTVGVLPADTKLIRVRGPMTNTDASVGTYTVYVRPFRDEVSILGTLSLFNTPSTIYTINGVSYVGLAGINALSVLSAGNTMTAAYTTFTPSFDTLTNATAGTFYPLYVVGGNTLEDIYTEGLSGEVIARSGNTLTLRNSTLFLNTAFLTYSIAADTRVLVGPKTTVTADGTTLAGLNSDSIAVGQRIEARGLYSVLPSGQTQLDATGVYSATASVRLLPTQLWGSLVSSASGSLTMNLQAINDWPVGVYNFSGNGATAAQNPSPAAFMVNSGTLTVPAGTVAGDPLWINGLVTPFGSAPPDFTASAINSQSSVQVAGGSSTPPGTQSCGVGSQVCEPASLRVLYSYPAGTTVPFTGLSNAGFSLDLTNPALVSAVIRIGPQNIDLKTLPTSPQIVPTALAPTTTFAPLYSVGNPSTASVTPIRAVATSSIMSYSSFPSFVTEYNSLVSASNAVLQVEARGVYDPTGNTFTATSIHVVL